MGENYRKLWVFGAVLLAALTGGLVRRKNFLGFFFLILDALVLGLLLFKTDIPVHVLSFIVDLLGLLPLGISKIFSLLCSLAPLPSWLLTGLEWAGGIAFSLVFWFFPRLFD